ncbi:MAG: response regulator [Proteobacteria bacterium]|nr:response regulator [Pseudomonadota bacterium]
MPVALRREDGIVVAAGLSRRGFAWLATLWALTLAYVAVVSLQIGGASRAFEEGGFIPLALSAAAGAWIASRREGAPRRDRVAWRLLALSFLVIVAGEVAWLLGPRAPALMRSLPDVLDGAIGHALMLAAFVLMIHRPSGRYAYSKLAIDLGLVCVVMAALAGYYQYSGGAAGETAAAAIRGVPDPVVVWGEFAMMVAITIVLHRPPTLGGGGALQLLALSKFASTIGTFMFESWRLTAWVPSRQASSIVFAVSAAGYASAGLLFACFDRRRGTTREWPRDVRMLPYVLMVTLGFVLLVEAAELWHDHRVVSGFVVVVLVAMTLTVLRVLVAGGQLSALARQREQHSRRLTTLVRRSHEAVLTIESSATIGFASPAAERLLAGTPGDIAGRALLDFVHEGDRAAVARVIAAPRDGELLAWRCGAGARWRDVESLVTDLRDEPGVHGVVLHCRDVTEQRREEREQRQSQKLEAVGLLAGGIAHDFNNLLTVIQANAELIRADHPEAGAGEVDEIERAAERGASLCRQLLAFSRSDAPQSEPQDVGELVADVEPMLRRVLPRDVQLVVRAERGAAFALVDTVQLDVVLLNLVTNSRDAMPDGGVVSVEADRLAVTERDAWAQRAIPPGDYARITVRDDGEGMSEAALAHAFEPFFTTKPQGKGTGLGLATVHGVVTSHGGYVRIDSAPGAGTAITMFFPFDERGAQRRAVRAPGAAPPSGQGRILVVEDEDGIRALIVRYLGRAGYELLEASDGVEALDVLGEQLFKVDLLLSDMTMPRMSGGTLVRRVRAENPDIAIIVMSGYAREDDEQSAPPADVAHVTKPFALGELGRVVRETMEKKRQGATR